MEMEAYELVGWRDHLVDETTSPPTVVQEGTPLNQTNFEHMDNGIFAATQKIIALIETLSQLTPEAIGAASVRHASQHAEEGDDPIAPGDIGAASKTHATQHAAEGDDPITPEAIGAAPLDSPTLTGAPTAPTPPTENNSTRIATTAYVAERVAALVNGSPEALDTLQELAAAMGNDPNFATTVLNALSSKASAVDLTEAQNDIATANTNITALQKAEQIFTTSGTAPAFTVADATITAYIAGLRRTVQFHAAGTNATINLNGLGAKALYEYTDKPMSVKAGQVVEVYYNGTYFFGVSVGGGVEFPSTPSAGNTTLNFFYRASDYSLTFSENVYRNTDDFTFQVGKSGILRFSYIVSGEYTNSRLTKNNVVVSGSEIQGTSNARTMKQIDVSVAAGDVIRQQMMTPWNTNYNVYSMIPLIFVSMLASDVQSAINDIVVRTP